MTLNNTQIFEKILLIGIGLIGGSILKDIKSNNLCNILSAYDKNSDDISRAYADKLIDRINTPLDELIKETDLIIICTPLLTYDKIFQAIDKYAQKSVLITDIGSVKQSVIDSARENLRAEKLKNFIPSHPIAGSEKSGFAEAKNSLFKNKNFYVTPISENCQESIDKICQLWQNIGSNILIETAQKHDKIFALSSHIPHLVSFCVCKTIKKFAKQNIDIIRQQNDGFARFIRLAYSNTTMWSDIFISNKKEILAIIDEYYIDDLNLCDSESLKLAQNNLQQIISFRTNIAKDNIKPQPQKNANITSEDQILTKIFPLIISAKVAQPVMDIFEKKIVGAGFLGMTKNLVNNNFSLLSLNKFQIKQLNDINSHFSNEVKIIRQLIEQNKLENYFL